MNVMNGLRLPDRMTLLIALAALLGAALVLARQVTGGPTLFADSIFFIAVARSLLAGDGFVGLWDEIYINEPPLYQLLLAFGGLGLVDPYSVAGPLNAAMFGLTIFALGRHLRRRLSSGYLVVWACFALALSLPMIGLAAAPMTGTPFILLATLALIRADDYLTEGKTSSLMWAVAFSALAWQTRYIGIVVVGVIGLALLLQTSAPLRDRLRRGVALGLAAGLPMAAWILRNYMATGRLTEYLTPVDYSVADLALEARGRFWDWVYFNPEWVRVEGLAFLPAASAALLIAALGAIAVGYVAARVLGGARMAELPHPEGKLCWLFGGFALAYAALFFFFLAALGRPFHGVEARYLTPLYAPLVVVAAVGADRLLVFLRDGGIARRWRAWSRLAGAALPVALALWLVMQVVPNARAIAWHNSDEFSDGYGGRQWGGSQILRHIRENPMDGDVSVNYFFGIVFLHNSGEAQYFDSLDYRHYKTDFEVDEWATGLTDGTWLVWFKEYYGAPKLDGYLPHLRALEGLRPIVELSDGAIFRVDADYRPDARNNSFIAEYEGTAAGDYGHAAAYSDFSVYWDDGRLLYLREPCVPEDIYGRFLLHIYPSDGSVLRNERGFVNADFDFGANGALFEGKCIGMARLPDYGIERVVTGQFVSGEARAAWRVDVAPDSVSELGKYADAYRAAARGEYGDPAAAQAEFGVYSAGNRLVYIKESCEAADVDARFFLHIVPADAADLAAGRTESGFDNMDFWFADEGVAFEGKCVAVAELPGYAIEGVRTGQYVSGEGVVWRVEFGWEE